MRAGSSSNIRYSTFAVAIPARWALFMQTNSLRASSLNPITPFLKICVVGEDPMHSHQRPFVNASANLPWLPPSDQLSSRPIHDASRSSLIDLRRSAISWSSIGRYSPERCRTASTSSSAQNCTPPGQSSPIWLSNATGLLGLVSNSTAIAFRWSSLSGRRPNKYGFMTCWPYMRFDTGMFVDRAGPS